MGIIVIHYTEEEEEAQRGQATGPSSHSCKQRRHLVLKHEPVGPLLSCPGGTFLAGGGGNACLFWSLGNETCSYKIVLGIIN